MKLRVKWALNALHHISLCLVSGGAQQFAEGASTWDVRTREGRGVTEKQTKCGRLHELYSIFQLQNADLGEGGSKIPDVIYGSPQRGREGEPA